MYRIMIVEDDAALASRLVEGLGRWDFDAVTAGNFDNVLEDFIRLKPQMVMMDINLPSFDGFHWSRKIREISRVPILFLSSRDAGMDVVMAVHTGGDDYMTKPVAMSVLIAKIQAILRRTYEYSAGNSDWIEHRGLILKTGESAVFYGGSQAGLTRNELKILTLLLGNRGKVVTRDALMQLLWDNDEFVNENTLTVNINRLRSKLSDLGLSDFIDTKKGQGYIIS